MTAVSEAAAPETPLTHDEPLRGDWGSRFRAGVVATLPLQVGVVPFGIVFGASALANGWSAVEVMALSMLVFAGSAQVAILTLTAAGAPGLAIVLAVVLLNLRHIFYGMSLARWLPPDEPPPRWIIAALMTDESFGLTVVRSRFERISAAFFFGSGLTMYGFFILSTVTGILIGQRVPNLTGLGLDLIFPLVFFALLLMIARGWRDGVVAVLAATLVMVLRRFVDNGSALLLATIVGAAFGAWLTRDQPEPAT